MRSGDWPLGAAPVHHGCTRPALGHLYAAFRDGADEPVTFWGGYRDMMWHPLTDIWNKTLMDQWVEMHEAGVLEGIPEMRLGL